MDISTVVAFGALFVAAGGPVMTAVIQSWHESKMYKNRTIKEHEYNAIEGYLKATGRYLFSHIIEDFGEASAEIFMYAPQELWEDIRELNRLITDMHGENDYHRKSDDRKKATKLYFRLCERFSPYSRSLKQKRIRKRRKSD